MEKEIFLTFDDGPNEPYTSEVLAVLEQFQAKATFFVCGKNIEKFPGSIRKIVEGGHAIGNHTYSHSRFRTLSGRLLEEIKITNQLIEKYAGVRTRLYRSPWGITVPWLKPKLLGLGFRIFRWDIATFDWWQPSAEFISGHVIRRAFPGAIVLLHDGDQTRLKSRRNTVKALSIILKTLGEQGYHFRTLS